MTSASSAWARVHEGCSVVVCVGPGGVGKTTLAAALAIDAADRGRRVALVTIDPARRLADALGLGGRLDDVLRPVPGVAGLEAAMLDTRASFDALVTRIARSDDDRARILGNRVYEAFSRTLARPHAYVAMERLHDLVHRGVHDLVVLDTPPTRSALDILDAPGRLSRFVGSEVATSLVDALAPEREGSVRGWLARRGQAALAGLLSRLLGSELATELASFFEVFLHLREGFATRADEVQALLRAPRTHFVLAVAPDATHLEDAGALAAGLAERDVALRAVLVNRLARLRADDAHEVAPCADPVLLAARAHRDAIRRTDHRRMALARAFLASLPTRTGLSPAVVAFPWLAEAPCDVDALRHLSSIGDDSSREFAPGKVSL